MSKPQVIKFKTGLTLIYKYNKNRKHSYVSFMFNSGQYNDPLDKLGLAHFTEHSMFLSNKKYSKEEKSEIFHNYNGNASTGLATIAFYATIADEEFEEKFGVLANWLTDYTIPQDEFDKEKEVILQEILRYREGAKDVLRNLHRKTLYPQPIEQLGVEIFGTVESVKSITRQDILDNIARTIVQDNCVMVVCGNAKLGTVKKLIKKHIIGSMPQTSGGKLKSSNEYIDRVTIDNQQMFVEASPDGDRSKLDIVSYCILTRDLVSSRKIYILNNIIKPLAFNIFRNKYGLCYSTDAFFSVVTNETGNWQLCEFTVTVSCDKANVQKVLEVMPEFYASLANYKVNGQSLKDAQKRIRCNKKAASPLSTYNIGNSLLWEYVGEGRLIPKKERKKIKELGDKLSQQEVIDFEKQILMQKPYVYIVANVDKSQLTSYDELTQKIADSLKWLNDYGPEAQNSKHK